VSRIVRTRLHRRTVIAVVAAVLVVAGVVVLAQWTPPPTWLTRPHKLSVTIVGWVSTHPFQAIQVVALAVGAARLVVALVERRERRKGAEDPPRDRDRTLMLRRVRNRWIKGVLEKSLAEEVRIRLGLERRPEAIAPLGMLRQGAEQTLEPLPAGTSVSTVFAELDSGLLILGAPGSGKTTGLLELARDLLDEAEADKKQPMPVVFNLSSWAVQHPPLAEWLIEELHSNYKCLGRSAPSGWLLVTFCRCLTGWMKLTPRVALTV
jgi:hypothetical protein